MGPFAMLRKGEVFVFRNLQSKFSQGKGDQNKGREGMGGRGKGRVITHQKQRRNGRGEMKDKHEQIQFRLKNEEGNLN